MPKRRYLLPEGGNFYKANLHCHSTFSDGKFTVEKLKEIYKEQGYHIIAFSDHNKLENHMDLCDPDFLPITSVEINFDCAADKSYANPTYHVNFFSKNPYADKFIDFERVYDINTINDVIKRANKSGFLAQYNHPRWSYQDVRDFLPLEGLFGFETYNHGCEVEMLNGFAEFEYEIFSRNGRRCACIATDDNHNFRLDTASPHNDSFGGFTMIKAPDLSYDSILAAMERKDCYASTKPLIYNLYVEGGIAHIECSPCNCTALRSDSRLTCIERTHDNSITSFDFKLDFPYEYIRFECTDSQGNKAMTRAYFKDEIE